MTAGQSEGLRSGLNVLQELDLNQLIAVQYDLTKEIERRVSKMQDDLGYSAGNVCVSKLKVGPIYHLSKEENTTSRPPENKKVLECSTAELSPIYKSGHNEDIVPTQFEHSTMKLNVENPLATVDEASSQPEQTDDSMLPGTLDMQSKEIDFSSPLRGGQNIVTTVKSGPVKRALAIISDSEGELDWSDSEYVSTMNDSGKKIRVEEPTVQTTDFNYNPVTRKPWIFEDFKANEKVNFDRGRKQIDDAKLAKFYAVAGKPESNQKLVLNPETGFQLVKKNIEINNGTAYDGSEFYNLRTRCKSPPGYGRLDFPNTQENLADKEKAQEMLYTKTKERFMMATMHAVPQSERRFLFRSTKLNELVTANKFKWDENGLQIFSRETTRK